MWQVTTTELKANYFSFSFAVNSLAPPPQHMYTLKHTYIFVLRCSEFPRSHTPKQILRNELSGSEVLLKQFKVI